MANVYRHFIANCEVAASLTPLTGGPNGPIEMSNEQLAAFERLMTSLADAPHRQRSALPSIKEKVIIDGLSLSSRNLCNEQRTQQHLWTKAVSGVPHCEAFPQSCRRWALDHLHRSQNTDFRHGLTLNPIYIARNQATGFLIPI